MVRPDSTRPLRSLPVTDFLDRPAGWIPPELAEAYDETSLWSARFGALLFEHLEIRRGVKGLDVGCGTGFPLIELALLHGASSHFTGLDIWPEGLARARRKAARHGLTHIEIVEGDGASMPFPDAEFDLVVSSIGVNNFADAPAALRECRRVAKRGARLVLTTNVQGHFGAFYALLDGILAEQSLDALRDALRHEEQHRRTKEALAELLAGCGFQTTRTFEQSFDMRFADGSAMLRHPLVKWFLDGWRSAIGAEQEREIFALAEAHLNTAAERESSVLMTVPMLYLEAVAV
jgi:ubiquinone/menaquinone biosynthesis C-methylase UbiE